MGGRIEILGNNWIWEKMELNKTQVYGADGILQGMMNNILQIIKPQSPFSYASSLKVESTSE